MFRVGLGYDIHRFAPGRRFVLGGVEIPHKLGLLGHSDADVLLHATCDALLGAMGEGDIGEFFPDAQAEYKDISSLKLLKRVGEILKQRAFVIENISAVVLLEEPKIAHLKAEMKANIAAALEIDLARIAISATTQETVGEIGKGRAAAAYATVLIKR